MKRRDFMFRTTALTLFAGLHPQNLFAEQAPVIPRPAKKEGRGDIK